MPEFRDPVDVEDLLVEYLKREGAPLRSILGDQPAWTDLPRDWAPAPDGAPGALRVTSFGGRSLDPAGHVSTVRIQIDAFGETPALAFSYAAKATTDLRALPGSGWRYPGAVVNSTTVSDPRRLPSARENGIPGYFVEVILVGHAAEV